MWVSRSVVEMADRLGQKLGEETGHSNGGVTGYHGNSSRLAWECVCVTMASYHGDNSCMCVCV